MAWRQKKPRVSRNINMSFDKAFAVKGFHETTYDCILSTCSATELTNLVQEPDQPAMPAANAAVGKLAVDQGR